MTVLANQAPPVRPARHQPYEYARRELVEPDWRRLPGWRNVTVTQWRDVQWQRAHCVKNARQLREVTGNLLDERFYADLADDQQHTATMSMLTRPSSRVRAPSTSTGVPVVQWRG